MDETRCHTPQVCVYAERQHQKLATCIAQNLRGASLDVTVVVHEATQAAFQTKGRAAVQRELSSWDALVVLVSGGIAADNTLANAINALDSRRRPVVAVLPPGTTLEPVWADGREVAYPDFTHTRVRKLILAGLSAAGLVPPLIFRNARVPIPPPEPALPLHVQDPARFRAHYPKDIAPGTARDLWFYAYRESAAAAVADDAHRLLGAALPHYRQPAINAQHPVEPGARIVIRPQAEGIAFDPEECAFHFVRPWHRLCFRMTATDVANDTPAPGEILVVMDGLILGRIALAPVITNDAQSSASNDSAEHAGDERVFVSYSHCDGHVVTVVESALRTLGIDVLRDRTTIRAGADWRPTIQRLIREATLFQLFWSHSAAESEEVRKEWQLAQALVASGQRDSTFIRCFYWQDPMPVPPPALSRYQFRFEDAFLRVR